jgi:hypothetical protein
MDNVQNCDIVILIYHRETEFDVFVQRYTYRYVDMWIPITVTA